MRLFVVLRSVFFLLLLTASLVFVLHKQLCINYVPHELNEFAVNCKNVLQLISKVRSDVVAESDRAARSTEEQDLLLNATLFDDVNFDNLTLAENITMVAKWHTVEPKEGDQKEIITFNVKTCFDFSLHEILSDSHPKYSLIVFPLRLTLILIVTSFLVAVLDLSLRIIIQQLSLIQCFAHSLVQIGLWGTILVNMEMYRRDWVNTWIAAGQTLQEIPMYPDEWTNFEIYAFVIMLLSIMDSVLFEHLSKKIRLVASEGIYKCIQQDFD